MAADRIKGITVKIGGDTTDLSESLKGINSESRAVGKELSDVQRLLRFNPGDTRLMAQQEELLNRQIQITTQRLQQLRDVEGQVRAQFAHGEIDAGQMRAFERELISAEGRLQHFENQARTSSRNVKAAFSTLGEGVKGAILTAVAGEGLQEVVSQALESAHLQTQIKVGFDVPPEQQATIQDAINSIKAYGIDGEEALSAVRKQWALNGDKSSAYNEKIIQEAGMISKAYQGIDLGELIQESYEIGQGLGISNEQAMGMVNTLLKMGFPPDQLDIIAEYGQQLKRAGFDASQIQGIFAAGIKTGDWNIDNLLDGLKEGRIRLAEFGQGVNKSTQTLLQGTGISTKQLQDWGKAVAGGGAAGTKAMDDVGKALLGINDKTKQNAVGVALFGTQFEDNGTKIMDALAGATTQAGDLDKNVQQVGADTNKMNADPTVALGKAMGDLNIAMQPIYTAIANFVAKIAEWASKNPELAASIVAVTVGIGILIGLVAGLAAVIGVLDGAAVALDIALLPLIGILIGIVAAVALVAFGCYELITHWKEVKAWAINLGTSIKNAFNEWVAGVKSRLDQSGRDIRDMWNGAIKFFKGINLASIGRDIIQGLINGIGSMASAVWDKAKSIGSGIGNAIRKAVNSSSPSKMTMEIGADIGKGLEIGLDNSRGMIDSASKRMAQAALPEVPTNNIQNQTVGGKSMVVNITSPKALDVREANREFNRTFNRMALQW